MINYHLERIMPAMATKTTVHQKHEERSLEFHRLVNLELEKDPDKVIQFGLQNISRWRKNGVDCSDFKVWERLLRNRSPLLPKILTGTDEQAVRLRQSSPFPGLLPKKARLQILEAHS